MITENLAKRHMELEKQSHICQKPTQQNAHTLTSKGEDKTMKIVSCTLATVAGICFVSGLVILTN